MLTTRLNEECFCFELCDRPDLVAPHPVFLDINLRRKLETAIENIGTALNEMRRRSSLIEAAAIYNSFDFHLTDSGPKLIEINVNAGGLFLQEAIQALLLQSNPACLDMLNVEPDLQATDTLLKAWPILSGGTPLKRIAIVDDQISDQPLITDMEAARDQIRAHGIACDLLDLDALKIDGNSLLGPHGQIDMVYNRSTDFEFTSPATTILRQAFEQNLAVIAPNPEVYRTYADKQLLLDLAQKKEVDGSALDSVLKAEKLTPDNAGALWEQRKSLVFKPMQGFGSKGVYRGDKISKTRWSEIISSHYMAQELAIPSGRRLPTSNGLSGFKADIRVWTHGIRPLHMAARLFSGQVMGMRQESEGFAPIIWTKGDGNAPC